MNETSSETEGKNVEELTVALANRTTERDLLASQMVVLEDELVNHSLEEFEAVISDATREYWRGQLLENRSETITALREIVGRLQAAEAGGAAGGAASGAASGIRRPLHNRSQARPAVPREVGAGDGVTATDERAAKIRNRAHEISRADRVAFPVAFRRAEMEIAGG
jgi:hypothetical protein